MSSSFENDENLGVHPAGKPGDSEVACDIFNLDLPTGRTSILRQSQFENVANKTVPKGVKVCFQTPRRDPVTKRILSPSKTSKMNGLEECISNLESLKLTSPDESVSEKNSENEPVLQNSDTGGHGDVPIPPSGSYLLDLDNLDAINPFQSTNKMGFSPAKPCVGASVCRSPQIMGCLGDSKEVISTASDSEKVVEEALKSDLALDETLPMIASLENSVDHGFAAVPSTDSPVIIDPLKLLVAQSEQSLNDDTEELPRALSPAVPEPAQIPESKSEPLPVSNSEEEAPLPARAAYLFDFDNLDSVNPFQTGGSKIPNSPAQGRKEEPVKSSPPKQEHSLDEQAKVDDNPVTAPPVAEAPAPAITEQKAVVAEETSASEELSGSEPAPAADDGQAKLLEVNFGDDAKVTPTPPVTAEEDAPLPARGAYSFDFDNLDSVNPFQIGGSKIANSPAPGKKEQPVKSSPLKQEHSLDEQTKVDDHPVTAQLIAETPTFPEDKPVEETSVSKEIAPLVNAEDDAPLPAKGAYSFDFDNLDSVNPFQTGGSKIANSPAQGRKEQPVKSSPPKQDAHCEQTKVDNPVTAHPIVEATACTEDKPAVVKETPSSEPAPADDGQVKLLEFNFGDDTKVKRKPPFKKLGKKPQGTKSSEKVSPTEKAAPTENKPASSVEEPKPAAKTEPQDGQEPTEAALPKGSYPVNFDKWDDPNFNPFGAKAAMGNSPAAERKNPVVAPAPLPSQKPVAKVNSVQKETDEHTSAMNGEVRMEDAQNTTITVKQPQASHAPATRPSGSPPKRHMAPVHPEPTEMDQLQQNPNFNTAGQEEEFVSGNAFMSGFDGQMDYLEQFGSSTFAESALRKQSLYLKFDPLLRESPKKGAGGNTMGISLPRPSFATRPDAQKPADVKLSQGDSVKLLADLPAPVTDLPAPDPTVLDLLVPTFKQPVKNEDSIIEVLKYSQKDMDAALAKAREEAQLKGDKIKAEREALLEDKRQLGIALKEHDGLLEQILAEKEKEKQAILAELKKVQQEKDQALIDLNSMERSLSDLFKRLDKHKEVINGHKKDEETLKALVEEYASRIRQEGQRYKSLKAYAEEKISLANKEIAEVTGRNRAEVTGLQAQLKREQIRNQSLQMSLDQKIKDVEELNKVCEDLILNVQKN